MRSVAISSAVLTGLVLRKRAALTTTIAGLSIGLLFLTNGVGLFEPRASTPVVIEPPKGVDADFMRTDHEQPHEFEFMENDNVWG